MSEQTQELTTQQIIEQINNAVDPINVRGEIHDLNDYEEIAYDGTYSNVRTSYLYNPKTNSLIFQRTSKWQGEGTTYRKTTINSYVRDMMAQYEESHFNRFVEGLQRIWELSNQ